MNFGSGNHANAKVRGGVETEEQLDHGGFLRLDSLRPKGLRTLALSH